jgi:hypothetical protein
MARFLSPEWFAEVAPDGPGSPAVALDRRSLVLEQVVRDSPDGEVRYLVVVTADGAYIQPPSNAGTRPMPDLTISCDWSTATELAQGKLAAQAALMEGRLRVSGNLARLSGQAANLVGLDPVPDPIRRRTTY